MERRDFLKLSAAGAAVASVGLSPEQSAAQTAGPKSFTLNIIDTQMELIDGTIVNAVSYTPATVGTPRIPGPVLRVREGDAVTILLKNMRKDTHAFAIAGTDVPTTTIAPGATATVSFTAPVAGTYLYHDNRMGPFFRVLGLYGAFIVEPAAGSTGLAMTPFSYDKLNANQKTVVSRLFNAFGTSTRFPGGKWKPCASDREYSFQERIWILNQVDPRFNALLVPGGVCKSDASLTGDMKSTWQPRYFQINGRSGFDLAEGDDVVIRNYLGEPTLIRVVNAGLCYHSNHIHGNHLMEMTETDINPASPTYLKSVVKTNFFERDVWSMQPMQRKDMLLPLECPPDIPETQRAPLFDTNTSQEKLPLKYVMHCHTEMSNTAGGGNYPQGMVTHWEIIGGVGRRPATMAAL
ncbi:multicopper oxidase domain-containing protein [Alsobacter sp. R-9]